MHCGKGVFVSELPGWGVGGETPTYDFAKIYENHISRVTLKSMRNNVYYYSAGISVMANGIVHSVLIKQK